MDEQAYLRAIWVADDDLHTKKELYCTVRTHGLEHVAWHAHPELTYHEFLASTAKAFVIDLRYKDTRIGYTVCNPLQGKACMGHFVFFNTEYAEQGLALAVQKMASISMTSITAIIPKPFFRTGNVTAKCGFNKVATLHKACWMKKWDKYVDGYLLVRNET